MNRRAVIIALAAAALASVAVLQARSAFDKPVHWTPDGLYYQARVLELRGADRATAMQETFAGPMSAALRARDPKHTGNPVWVKYNERFYDRRVALPLAGAALYPLAGDQSLLYLSLLGYIAAVLALFGLLCLRFRVGIAAAVALATVILPPLVDHSSYPLTDSWGLTLETLALGAALLTLDRGLRWLPLWIATVVLLGFTRDTAWIPVLAAGWCAVRYRKRAPVALFATGIAAALPALLFFKAPVRELFALAVNPDQPWQNTSWSFIAGHYPHALIEYVRSDGGFLRRGQWYTALYFVGGIALFLIFAWRRRASRETATTLLSAAFVVAIGYLFAAPAFSAFRLELMFVPMAAFGLALAADRVAVLAAARGRRPAAVDADPAARGAGSPTADPILRAGRPQATCTGGEATT